ncbi:hypothetical protein Tco_0665773, partial [Tanacetum coccineum]
VNRKDVDKALRGVDCVFHLASFGMSGKDLYTSCPVMSWKLSCPGSLPSEWCQKTCIRQYI